VRARLSIVLSVALAACAFTTARGARADTPTSPSAEAVAAFDEGRKKMAEGDYAGAIAKFEQSVKSTRTVGALLNLGRAYEESGRAASAWATYRAASALARELHDRREADGDGFAAAILPKVSHLTIDGRALDGVQGAEVTCDGAGAALGEPVPVDAGKHVVAVSAPGKRPWSTTIDVGRGGALASVRIASLEDAPAPAPSAPVSSPDLAPTAPEPSSTTQRTIGYATGGVGVVSIATGAVLGLMAMSKHSQATNACPTYPDHCPSSGAADGPNHDAQTFATASTVTFVAGAVLVAAGAVIVLTAPHATSAPGTTGHVRLVPMLGLQTVGGGAEVVW
jgi:hypothetical protein